MTLSRGRFECCRALLRAGADPNYMNKAGDLTLFWGIDGGVEIIKLLHEYGADLDARTPKDWTPLSYCRAKGKYGATEEHGIYPEVAASHWCLTWLINSGVTSNFSTLRVCAVVRASLQISAARWSPVTFCCFRQKLSLASIAGRPNP